MHLDLLGNEFDVAKPARAVCRKIEELTRRGTLNPPAAIRQLPDLYRGIPYDDPVDYQGTVDQQARERNANTHLPGRNNTAHRGAADQFRVIKLELGPAKTPARVHAREVHLHTDRRTRPGLDLVLVLGQPRQEQTKQPNSNR